LKIMAFDPIRRKNSLQHNDTCAGLPHARLRKLFT
jgi:hypothetical protein